MSMMNYYRRIHSLVVGRFPLTFNIQSFLYTKQLFNTNIF